MKNGIGNSQFGVCITHIIYITRNQLRSAVNASKGLLSPRGRVHVHIYRKPHDSQCIERLSFCITGKRFVNPIPFRTLDLVGKVDIESENAPCISLERLPKSRRRPLFYQKRYLIAPLPWALGRPPPRRPFRKGNAIDYPVVLIGAAASNPKYATLEYSLPFAVTSSVTVSKTRWRGD